MFSIGQIRAVQARLLQASGLDVPEALPYYETIRGDVELPDQTLDLAIIDVGLKGGGETRGLAMYCHSDPKYLARLILPENQASMPGLRLGFGGKEPHPTLVGLHFVHAKRRSVDEAWYLFFGALTFHRDPVHGYGLIQERSGLYEGIAKLLYTLNRRVEDLPFPEGRILSLREAFERMGIRYVGELVQREPAELERKLRALDWVTVKAILQKLGLAPGTPIKQWKPPLP